MFLRSRRDCSKVSVPAKERGIPRAVSANALMSARGPGCVKTCTSRECAELFSLFSSFDGDCQSGSFLIQRNRDKLSTRKFDVGVFTQPGSKRRHRPATGPRLLYPPRTDIGDGKCDVRFVPIVLQKSQNAVRLIFRQKTNQATTADRCILKRASEVANENGSGFTSIQTKRSKSTIRRVLCLSIRRAAGSTGHAIGSGF